MDEEIREARAPVCDRLARGLRFLKRSDQGHSRRSKGQRLFTESERQRVAVGHRTLLAHRFVSDGAGVARLRPGADATTATAAATAAASAATAASTTATAATAATAATTATAATGTNE
jgi:hypothetical protein